MHTLAEKSVCLRAARTPSSRLVLAAAIAVGALIPPGTARAGGGPQNVLVVIEPNIPESVAIGEYYVAARDIPPCNVLRLPLPPIATFDEAIQFLADPIDQYIAAQGLTDQIDYIVLTKGIPYRFAPALRDSVASILFSRETEVWDGSCDLGGWPLRNPYYRAAESFDYNRQYVRSTIPLRNRRLVMMLSGFSLDGAYRNIDSGVAADETHPDGTIYFFSARLTANQPRLTPRHTQIAPTRAELDSLGVASQHFVVATEDEASLYDAPDVMGYFTGTTRAEVLSNTYRPGAVADHLTSFGGILLQAGGQMSILEFTDAGVAGSSGTVTEPCNFSAKFVNALLYTRYAVGFNLAESLWMSLDQPWQSILVGDPLASPWAVRPVVTILSPDSDVIVVNGQLPLHLTALHPRGDCLSRIDLFLDGKYFQTLTDLRAPAGNVITLTADGIPLTYTTAGGEDANDILSALQAASSAWPTVTAVLPATEPNRSGYINVQALTAGTAGNGIPVSIAAAQGNASALGVAVRADGSQLVGGRNLDSVNETAAVPAICHVYASVGRPTIDLQTVVPLGAIPDGDHELRVVAYQGDAVMTQGFAKLRFNSKFGAVGDVNGDGLINLLDFNTFAACYGLDAPDSETCTPPVFDACDLTGDNRINVVDFATFAVNFDG